MRVLYVLALVLAVCACGGTPTNPTQDWVAIKSSTPPTTTVLKAGDTVTFSVSADATLVSADSGVVRLLITTGGMVPLNNGAAGPPNQTISKGLTTVTLTDTVTIPSDMAGSTVVVVVPIWLESINKTAQFARVSYQVQ